MKDKTIFGILIGITIGIFLMAYPIVKSGGGFTYRLKDTNSRVNKLGAETAGLKEKVSKLEERMKKEESIRWFGK